MLQRILMTLASISAARLVWNRVKLPIALFSMLANFANRGHDVLNCAVVITLSAWVT